MLNLCSSVFQYWSRFGSYTLVGFWRILRYQRSVFEAYVDFKDTQFIKVIKKSIKYLVTTIMSEVVKIMIGYFHRGSTIVNSCMIDYCDHFFAYFSASSFGWWSRYCRRQV